MTLKDTIVVYKTVRPLLRVGLRRSPPKLLGQTYR